MTVYALGERVPSIHPDAFIHPDAVVIGRVTVGEGASIWPGAVLRGDYGTITIGDRTSVQDGVVIHATAELATVVGADCVIGHLAHLEGCVVEDGALIGSGSIVLHEAVIRSGALVGAGAVVSGGTEVPSRGLAIGIPARVRPDAVDTADIERNAAMYVKNGQRYRDELRRID